MSLRARGARSFSDLVSFLEEVHTLSCIRHQNIQLFMGAAVQPSSRQPLILIMRYISGSNSACVCVYCVCMYSGSNSACVCGYCVCMYIRAYVVCMYVYMCVIIILLCLTHNLLHSSSESKLCLIQVNRYFAIHTMCPLNR